VLGIIGSARPPHRWKTFRVGKLLTYSVQELWGGPPVRGWADCVVIVTDYAGFDYNDLMKKAPLIVDTRNALKGVVSDKIVRL
jgi:hypothetical protein